MWKAWADLSLEGIYEPHLTVILPRTAHAAKKCKADFDFLVFPFLDFLFPDLLFPRFSHVCSKDTKRKPAETVSKENKNIINILKSLIY